MKSYITAIGTANPGQPGSQEQAADFMIAALNIEAAKGARLRKLYQSTGIQQRYSVLEDFHRTRGEFEFFSNASGMEPMPGVSRRMEVFRSAGLKLALIAAENCLRQSDLTDRRAITHLIMVSCTGMSAPGLDIELVDALCLAPGVHRTAINFMGCYAAFNAIKTVLFVLNEILGQLNGRDSGKKILSFAFGPGLTLESMLLEIHHV